MYFIINRTDITVVCFADVPVDIDALKKRMKNAKVCALTWLNIVSGSGTQYVFLKLYQISYYFSSNKRLILFTFSLHLMCESTLIVPLPVN